MATRLDATATRLEAIATRLEAISTRLEAISTKQTKQGHRATSLVLFTTGRKTKNHHQIPPKRVCWAVEIAVYSGYAAPAGLVGEVPCLVLKV